MPTRRAILIGTPSLPNHDYLNGVTVDLENYSQFLQSNYGGAWEKEEIKILNTPSKYDLSVAMIMARSLDYTFITFSGHGEHVSGKGIYETRICINEKEDMAVYELNPGNKRHVVIIDACRKVRAIMENFSEKTALANALQSAPHTVRSKCRELFDKAVASSEEGRTVMYSCEVNQTAGEKTGGGGVFSEELVNNATGWATNKAKESWSPLEAVLRMNEAFQYASEATYRINAPQKPVYEGGRRHVHLPFAVAAS
jgi:hypothetical protein